jgi:hypothetical protein
MKVQATTGRTVAAQRFDGNKIDHEVFFLNLPVAKTPIRLWKAVPPGECAGIVGLNIAAEAR